MTNISKKARKQLGANLGMGLPPKAFFLNLLSDATKLLNDIGAGDVKISDVFHKILRICSAVDGLFELIKHSDVAQAELKCEMELDLHKIVSSLDDDVLQELIDAYKKDTGNIDDGFQKVILDIKSQQLLNKD